ncbi:MAG: hypothetical protein N2422_01005 [Rhodobacteraceae bacterium]|nr:hypothetical protein [Paracoccaceae bacterium]
MTVWLCRLAWSHHRSGTESQGLAGMAATSTPASPVEDIAAWQRQHPSGSSQPLTPDLVAFAQRGVSVIMAAPGANGRPAPGIAVGCRIAQDGSMRILLGRAGNVALLEAVGAGAGLAVTFTAAPDHRSFQVKTSHAEIRPATSDDLPEMDRQTACFMDDLLELGFPPELARGYVAFDPADLIAIEFLPDRVFTQTPGPGAGAELKR